MNNTKELPTVGFVALEDMKERIQIALQRDDIEKTGHANTYDNGKTFRIFNKYLLKQPMGTDFYFILVEGYLKNIYDYHKKNLQIYVLPALIVDDWLNHSKPAGTAKFEGVKDQEFREVSASMCLKVYDNDQQIRLSQSDVDIFSNVPTKLIANTPVVSKATSNGAVTKYPTTKKDILKRLAELDVNPAKWTPGSGYIGQGNEFSKIDERTMAGILTNNAWTGTNYIDKMISVKNEREILLILLKKSR